MGPSLTSTGPQARSRRQLDAAIAAATSSWTRSPPSSRQDIVDIMLVSASNLERLNEARRVRRQRGQAGDPRQRHHRHLGRARRQLSQQPSRPFRSAPVARDVWRGRADAGRHRRHRPRPLLDHLQQRPRRRHALARGLRRLPRRRAPAPASSTSSRSSTRTSTPASTPERHAALRQRLHPALPRRRHQGRAAALPEDRLQRPEGAGGAGLLRPQPDRRRARRRRRHHARLLRAAAPGRALRRARRPVRPQDQPRRSRRWRSSP